jgi:hypothetical protein
MFGIMRSSGAGRNFARYPSIAFYVTNANEFIRYRSQFAGLPGDCAMILDQGAELLWPVIGAGGRIL